MGASASVIQEYYKAVDYWADIVGNRDWKLSVWIVGQNDVDLSLIHISGIIVIIYFTH